jgi:kynurenine formamidase
MHDQRRLERRSVSISEFEAMVRKYRTWHLYGPDDELGAANRVTQATVSAALAAPRRGRVFQLAIPLASTGPLTGKSGRVNPQHVMLRHGGDIMLADGGPHTVDYTDDVVYMPMQSATQWDGLCHIFYGGRTYNGRGPESVDGTGARSSSITNLIDRCVGRGVLLDIPRWLGVDWLEAGAAIQGSDLAACAEHEGVDVGPGDFVLLRTGWLARSRQAGTWEGYLGSSAPGLGVSAADYICPRGAVAVASDTAVGEAIPFETADIRLPLHVLLLVNAGIYLGEMWDLENLAEDCAAEGTYDCLLVAPPLPVTGAVGSPVTPIAIR